MGVTEYPCPGCGQAQKVRAPNGQEVAPELCAACKEKEPKEHGAKERAKEYDESQGSDNKAKARTR